MSGLPPVIRLANDIAIQFPHLPHDDAVAAIALHMNSFWDPRMRRELVAIADDNRGDLHDIVVDVLPLLHADVASASTQS